ncbi:MAG: GDSL-type esterase/lipase family protein [Chloroflexi bacterium]|nr:GDSL-type esterase/lipase family protein [Chloroflexota bacterium]
MLLIFLGILALLFAAVATAFTVGSVVAVIVVLVIVAATIYAVRAGGGVARAVLGAQAVVFLLAVGFLGFTAFQVVRALNANSGESDSPNATTLASADRKLDAAQQVAGFRLELTRDELVAVLLDSLRESDDNPIRSVELTIVDGEGDLPGVVDFTMTFKGGGLKGSGRIGASLDAGRIELDIHDVSMGNLSLPGIARGAVSDVVDTVLNLNDRLAAAGADVQALEIGNDRVLIVGAQTGGELLTSQSLLAAIEQNAASLAGAVSPPPEQLGPGDVNALESDGPSYIVALGDSLAANVGVTQPREGYVSRFHRVVAGRDGVAYGLSNFGVAGETSGTLISDGQLARARRFIDDHEVAYVTLDVGANDLLGHLGSNDCANDVRAAPCQARLVAALVSYEANLERIVSALRDAVGGETPILVLLTYNPFSLGFGGAVGLEAGADDATTSLNDVARDVGARHGALIADGQAALRGTAAATTHMLDASPDVHPRAIGYDLLASALVDALP